MCRWWYENWIKEFEIRWPSNRKVQVAQAFDPMLVLGSNISFQNAVLTRVVLLALTMNPVFSCAVHGCVAQRLRGCRIDRRRGLASGLRHQPCTLSRT